MKLYLVRHSAYNDADLDPEKGISELGKKQSEKIAEFLKKHEMSVSEIWHSDKKRAIQTAEIIGDIISAPTSEKNFLKANDPIKTALVEIELAENDLMLVGHLPFMSNLASFLLMGQEFPEAFDFPQVGTMALNKLEEGWQMEWLVGPELI